MAAVETEKGPTLSEMGLKAGVLAWLFVCVGLEYEAGAGRGKVSRRIWVREREMVEVWERIGEGRWIGLEGYEDAIVE
jgi:hypothetical protein